MYLVWYRRAAGIATIFQIINTSIGNNNNNKKKNTLFQEGNTINTKLISLAALKYLQIIHVTVKWVISYHVIPYEYVIRSSLSL